VVMGARSPATRGVIMSSLLDQAFDGNEVITASVDSESLAGGLGGVRPAQTARYASARVDAGSRAGTCRSRGRRVPCAVVSRSRGTERAVVTRGAAKQKVLASRSRPSKAVSTRTPRRDVTLASSSKRSLPARALERNTGKRGKAQAVVTAQSSTPNARAAQTISKPVAARTAKATSGKASNAKAVRKLPGKVRVAEGRRPSSS
jgi:hypothetical protein